VQTAHGKNDFMEGSKILLEIQIWK